MLLSERLADWVTRQPPQMSSQVANRVEELVLDSIACAAAGMQMRDTQLLMNTFGSSRDGTQVRAGFVSRYGIENTILLTSFAANCVDADDTHTPTMTHPGSVIVPAVLILAAVNERAGVDVVRSIAAGYEIAIRLASIEHYKKGWHSTGTIAIFGAVAALSSLLRLPKTVCVDALCIAASLAAGIRANFGSPTRSLHAGRAASAAYLAVQLAREGFSARPDALEGRAGFDECFGDLVTQPSLAEDPSGLAIFEISFKPYASGVVTHAALDAAIAIRMKLIDAAERLRELVLTVAPMAKELAHFEDPTSGLEARLSLTHCVATGIQCGSGGPREFSDEAARDPVINTLRKLCRVRSDPGFDGGSARLKVRLSDGSECEEFVRAASGTLLNPIKRDGLTAKFTEYFRSAHTDCKTNEVLTTVLNLRTLSNVSALTKLLEWL